MWRDWCALQAKDLHEVLVHGLFDEAQGAHGSAQQVLAAAGSSGVSPPARSQTAARAKPDARSGLLGMAAKAKAKAGAKGSARPKAKASPGGKKVHRKAK